MKRKNTSNELSHRPHFAWQEQVVARTDLSPYDKVVLWRLALHLNLETGRCDPKISTLMEGAGVSESTVQRAIAKGEKLGLIAVERSSSGHHYDHNSYRILHSEGVSSQTPVEDDIEGEGVSSQTPTGVYVDVSNNNKTNDRAPSVPLEREFAANAAGSWAPASTSFRPPPRGKKKKEARAAAGNSSLSAGYVPGMDAGFDEMRRNNSARPNADDIDEDHRAYCRALQLIDRDTLLANHKAYVKATVEGDGAKYLKSIAVWCDRHGWETPLPRPKRKSANGSRRHSHNGARRQRSNASAVNDIHTLAAQLKEKQLRRGQ